MRWFVVTTTGDLCAHLARVRIFGNSDENLMAVNAKVQHYRALHQCRLHICFLAFAPMSSYIHQHSVKVTIYAEAERELPGQEMVWNNDFTTATVPRGLSQRLRFFPTMFRSRTAGPAMPAKKQIYSLIAFLTAACGQGRIRRKSYLQALCVHTCECLLFSQSQCKLTSPMATDSAH